MEQGDACVSVDGPVASVAAAPGDLLPASDLPAAGHVDVRGVSVRPSDPATLPAILPTGTQVVALIDVRGEQGQVVHTRGVVGLIVRAPADLVHAYRVRFVDGREASLMRHEMAVQSHYLADAAGGSMTIAASGLMDRVIVRAVIGSRAYGLATEASDTDRRGVYLPTAEQHWSLSGTPEQIDNDAAQETYWELQKFIVLALKANPNVLEVLYSPIVEFATPLGRRLIEVRSKFLSRLVYQTYNGYVLSQFRKLNADLSHRGEPKWKHVMHLIRLLHSGIVVLREGYVPVAVDPALRDALLAIRRGERPLDEIDRWRLSLHRELDEAAAATSLPDQPDYRGANGLLIDARRAALADGLP